ncbi:hypothetical protein [Spongiactinospora sp. TRM90649]|uniref:hypothetical protein n=1 Tax=Spongiactinospora sp. TRM90649 TaxID=3031114 RepID=UPI0023F95E1F|nr:hypothetical protein [Spongiactinospora sp. TRM90649]MDF5754632.1 hypothetical protein [Spongiactinospora sp. TRM90649]
MTKTGNRGLFSGRMPDGSRTGGVIGSRKLVAVQTFDIARLTTHPVPVVPGCFVAVTGQGPKGDSNGSGKTTFLSAVALLLGDPQWRLDLDGRYATNLLFRPGAAGLDTAVGGAEHGYVVGIFARDDAGADDPVTVWIRVSKRPAYVLMRWAPGLHGVSGTTDQERLNQADAAWQGLPTNNERGSRQMASTLFGAAPRCLAYLDTPIRPSVPSLLSQQMTDMSPDTIGAALIALTGRDHLLTKELELRRAHADQVETLADRQAEDQRQQLVENIQLEALERRRRARSDLEQADRSWEIFLGKGLLERAEQDARKEAELQIADQRLQELRTSIDELRAEQIRLSSVTELQQALDEAGAARDTADQKKESLRDGLGRLNEKLDQHRIRRGELTVLAAGADGRSVDEHESQAATAADQELSARLSIQRADKSVRVARDQLAAVENGHDGFTQEGLGVLAEAGVPAVCLADVVELQDDHRSEWEPRLWRYRNAFVVGPDDQDCAEAALARIPGSTLVLADGPLHLPPAQVPVPGVTSSVGLTRFLSVLESRQEHRDAPGRVHDAHLSETLLGEFTEPFLGRAARLARAWEALNAALREHEESVEELTAKKKALEHAERLLEAARATVSLADLRKVITASELAVSETQKNLAEAQREWHGADERYTTAKSAVDNHAAEVERLTADIKHKETEHGRVKRERGRLQEERDRLRLIDWTAAWGDTLKSAAALVGVDDRRPSSRVLDQTISQLKNAVSGLIHETTTVTPALAGIATGFDAPVHPLEKGAPHRSAYATVTQPIRDLLMAEQEHDEILSERIRRSRAERAEVVHRTEEELATKHDDLTKVQDMVETSVERALRDISDRLDHLDLDRDGGYGARLELEIVRPARPAEGWIWRVTPRWRRSPLGTYVSYREVANGAQIKVFAIQLVLAALLADDSVPGRILVLDELGNSLGDANRKDVLAALNRVAAQQSVTILGTCQDSVIYDAADECGEILWFSHASTTDPYNQPTRAWGFDPDRGRVELTAQWLMEGRTG